METTPAATPSGARGRPRKPARAEVIGSLLRPRKLLEAVAAFYEKGHTALLEEEREKDRTQLRTLEDEAIAEVVARQIDIGLDVVTDGEFRRLIFFNVLYDSVSGLAPNTDPTAVLQFVGDDGSTVEWPGAPVAVDRLRKIDSPVAREVEFLASITDHPFKVTVPSASLFLIHQLGVFKPGVTDRVYRHRRELVEDMVSIDRQLVDEAVAAGARYVQFDYPIYTHLVDPAWTEAFAAAGLDVDGLLDEALALDRKVVEGLPADVTLGMHFCRGNYRSRYLARGSLEPLAERLFSELPYDVFLIEWDDVARQGDYSPIRFVPEGRMVVLGLVSSKKPEVESYDDIARRLDEASRYLDPAQLALSTQCGFASALHPEGGTFGNELSEDAQWRKLEFVATVADRVWGGA